MRKSRRDSAQIPLDLPGIDGLVRQAQLTPDYSASNRRLESHPQTRAKLAALQAYVPGWFGVFRSRTAGDLWAVEPYSGPGLYNDAGAPDGIADGSPVIIARAALATQDFLRSKHSLRRVHLRFIEVNHAHASALTTVLRPYVEQGLDIQVIQGDADKRLPEVMREIGDAPVLVFVDPDGKPPFQLIRAAARPGSEVIITFDIKGGVLRVAGQDISAPSMTDWWGGDGWQFFREPGRTVDVPGLLMGYRRRLREELGFPYTHGRRIRYSEGFANADRALIQASWSPRGCELWNRALNRVLVGSEVQVLGLSAEVSINAAIQTLAAAGDRTIRYGDIVRATEHLGELGESDLHQALLFLREHQRVTWTSSLHRASRPRPIFSFVADPAAPPPWDLEHRREEPPLLGSAGRGTA